METTHKIHPHMYTENNYNSSYGVYVFSSLFAIFLSFSRSLTLSVYIDLIVLMLSTKNRNIVKYI